VPACAVEGEEQVSEQSLDDWWRCAQGAAEAIKVFDHDPRPVNEIANEVMNDFLDSAAEIREWMAAQ
jgi:hypothetical protein